MQYPLILIMFHEGLGTSFKILVTKSSLNIRTGIRILPFLNHYLQRELVFK